MGTVDTGIIYIFYHFLKIQNLDLKNLNAMHFQFWNTVGFKKLFGGGGKLAPNTQTLDKKEATLQF